MRRVTSLLSLALLGVLPRSAHAQVTFTPAADLARSAPGGVTFTPGARRESPAVTPERATTTTPCDERAASAQPAVITQPAASAQPAVLTQPAAMVAHIAAPEPRVAPAQPEPAPARPEPEPARPEPPAAPATACSLVNGIEELSLDDAPRSSREAPARAMELSLSAWGRDVVALVTMARVGGGREGLVFSQSRVISLAADRTPTVSRGPGFEPGAVVALGPDSTVYVLSSARFDVRNQRGARDLELTVLDANATVRTTTRSLEGTRGFTVDSPPVAWRGGLAVVLGEPSLSGPERTIGPVRERVYTFDRDGAARAAPWVLTEAQTPDAVGRFRVGLGRIAGGDALAAVFTDPRGLHARRFVGGAPTEPATRIVQGRAWAPEVSADGASVVFREDGYDGRPVRLRSARWDGANVADVGQGWEPLATVVRGRTLVAGALVSLDNGQRTTALFTESAGRERARTLAAPHGAHLRMDDAIDVAMTPTDDGAVLAWIESTDRTRPDAPRRLAYARVRCP